MKREILFKGKLSHKDEWVVGNLIIANNGSPYIVPFNVFEPDGHHLRIDSDNAFWVIPETVGQFTGLLDKNKVRIFEDDICKSKTCAGKYQIKQVKYHHYGFFAGDYPISENCEIIGNIHDNPSLL